MMNKNKQNYAENIYYPFHYYCSSVTNRWRANCHSTYICICRYV